VGAGNCRKERVGQSSASLESCSLWVEVDMHLVVAAWHAVKDEGACVPWAIAVDDSPLDRLEDVEGTVLQGDCHLRLLDLGGQTSRERTFDRLSPEELLCMYSRRGRGENFSGYLEG